MTWLKRWFHRHFLYQGEVDERMRQMTIEAWQAQRDHNMPPDSPMKPGPPGVSDHKPFTTRFYLPPKN